MFPYYFSIEEQYQILGFNISSELLIFALIFSNTVSMGPAERFAIQIFRVKKFGLIKASKVKCISLGFFQRKKLIQLNFTDPALLRTCRKLISR